MSEIIAIWTFLQQVGQVSAIAVAVALYFIWKNDLAHIGKDIAELKKDLKEHLAWHLDSH